MSAPDWPLIDYGICWFAGPADNPQQDLWYSLNSRTEGSTTVTRGKEYELDQVQPGEMDFTVRNDDGAFDPNNGSSLFSPHVLPYRLCRLRAQYPPTPANLLTPDQATAFYATKGALTTSTLPAGIGTASGLTATVAPLDGTSNTYVIGTGLTFADALTFGGVSIEQGKTYTAQVQFSCAVSIFTQLRFDWYHTSSSGPDSSTFGTAVSGLSGTATVTATPPAGAIGARVTVISGQSTHTVNINKLGFEAAAAPSAWTTPGTWYPMFTGYVERWPQAWDATGNYGTADLTAVDRFSWLANRGLNNAAFLEVLSTGPWRLTPLNEASGATSFSDYLGLRAPAKLYTPRSGVYQTLTAGNSVQTDSGAIPPAGLEGPVITFTNQASQTAAQLVDMTGGGQVAGFGSGVNAQWTRIVAFHAPKTPARAGATCTLFRANQKNYYSGESYVSVGGVYDGSGNFGSFNAIVVNNGTTVASTGLSGVNLSDGAWHLAAIAVDNSTNTMSLWLDGVVQTVTNTGVFPTTPSATDVLGGRLSTASKSTPGPTGDMALCADWQRILTNTEVANLWQAIQYGWGSQSPTRSETSGRRYQRILDWAQVTGTPRLATGSSVQYGPAVDLTADSKVLDSLQAVVETETGQHFIGADGQIVFQARSARYNTTPAVTFGEHGGEIAYTSASTDLDPTLVINDVTATATYGAGATATNYRVTDSNSGLLYGVLTSNRTINTIDSNEMLGAAQYVLYENKQPLLRFETLPVDVGANPSYWPTLLARELGDPVAVNRRPSNAPAMSMAGFVEQIVWSIDDQRHCSWSGQVSNAALHQFGVFDDAVYGKFDTTLRFGF